jgi:hypothetical protein
LGFIVELAYLGALAKVHMQSVGEEIFMSLFSAMWDRPQANVRSSHLLGILKDVSRKALETGVFVHRSPIGGPGRPGRGCALLGTLRGR